MMPCPSCAALLWINFRNSVLRLPISAEKSQPRKCVASTARSMPISAMSRWLYGNSGRRKVSSLLPGNVKGAKRLTQLLVLPNRINESLQQISTFLVVGGQHPEQVADRYHAAETT